ncbi:hypothetical protein [Victivallis vadensis]|uniref:alpha-L-rhamnosidase-related protein n=1 Tax=Victivallis vadensis TaxID=172901 RepID=UPI003D02B05C
MFYQEELRWAREAEALKPHLIHEMISTVSVVRTEEDSAVWQGWKIRPIASPEDIFNRELPHTWEYTFDFGRFCVGFPVLDFEFIGLFDAPFRLEIKMAETPCELARDFSSYHGDLGRSWLQEALIVEDVAVSTIRLPRRYAFRYLKLRVVGNFTYKVILRNVRCDTVSAADWSVIQPLGERYDELDHAIYRIGLTTLASCMQESFEDGPKRDRRLWLGDLRLQALANYNSFRNYNLVKRCLLMFAAAANEEGEIPGCVYPGTPRPKAGNYTFDYSVLFGDILLDYVNASGDEAGGRALFPVARRQTEIALRQLENSCFHYTGNYWLFVDWKEGLERDCAGHSIIIYSLMRTLALAQRLGLESETGEYPALIERMRNAGYRKWFDTSLGYFTSGRNRQISWASQIWAAFAKMLPKAEMRELLKRLLKETDVVLPGGPFLYNQMVLVLERYELHEEAYRLTRSFWGKMVELGADTFWEIFDPSAPMRSPYGDPIINSHCHAWSTPTFHFK